MDAGSVSADEGRGGGDATAGGFGVVVGSGAAAVWAGAGGSAGVEVEAVADAGFAETGGVSATAVTRDSGALAGEAARMDLRGAGTSV